MEKKYEITEKQLVFLNGFLLRKYPDISDTTRIELTDHLVSDFEATTDNGNLSQYLSNELEFIRKFVFNGVREVKKTYSRQTWNCFFDFFSNFKMIPYTLLIVVILFYLAKNLNNKQLWMSLIIIQSIIMLLSILFGMINKKKLRKVDEVKYLGAEIWLPFLMIQIPQGLEFHDFLMSNEYVFILYSLFTVVYGLSAFIVLRKQRKYILEKYKHLLN